MEKLEKKKAVAEQCNKNIKTFAYSENTKKYTVLSPKAARKDGSIPAALTWMFLKPDCDASSGQKFPDNYHVTPWSESWSWHDNYADI